MTKPALLSLAAALALGACAPGTEPPSVVPSGTLSAADLAKPLPSPLPEIAARVNGQPVPTRNVALAARQLGTATADESKRPALVREAMLKLIVRELLFQEATARKLGPDEKAMEQAYNEARIPYKDDAAWLSFLKEQGMDEQTFRSELRVQYTVKSLLDLEAARVTAPISDDEARKFYEANPGRFESGERVKVRHIQFRIPSGMPADRKAELRTRVQAILLRARKGEDFAKLARDYSEDIGSKANGGELAAFGHGQLPKEFETAAFALKPGQVSDVVETPFGFHIIKMMEHLPSQKVLFEQVASKVKAHLQDEKRAQELEQLVSTLRTKARIETYL